MFKKLHELLTQLPRFSEHEQGVIKGLAMEAASLEAFESMKGTDGWKLLHKKLREELQAEILVAVKDNVKIQTLINILGTVETRQSAAVLEEEINRVLPDS